MLIYSQASISSLSSPNNVDSGDERVPTEIRVHEDDANVLDESNELPRTRVVPFISSPIHSSPPTDSLPETSIDSPSETLDSPVTSANNNNLPGGPVLIPLVDINGSLTPTGNLVPVTLPISFNEDNNRSTTPTQNLREPASLPFEYNEDNNQSTTGNPG